MPSLGDTASPIGQLPASEIGARSTSGSNGKSAWSSRETRVVEARKARVEPSVDPFFTSSPGIAPGIAGLVLDDDMAPEAALELGRDQAGDDVGAAVGLEADKDPQSPFGQDGLRPGGRGEERRRGAGGTAEEGAT